MFQRAHLRSRDTSSRAVEVTVKHAAPLIGKHSLAQDMGGLHPECAYERTIATAQRTVDAIRYNSLPALVAALRRKEMAPLAKEMGITQAAIELRHMLMVANQHVCAAEKGATYSDPIVLFLRNEINVLSTRAMKLGAYKGLEHLQPQGYKEPKQQQQKSASNKPAKTEHKHVRAKAPFAAATPVSVTRPKRNAEPPARLPMPRITRSPRTEAY